MVSTYAIMPAAGHGRRMGAVQPKQYLEICGKPILIWTVQALISHPHIAGMVLVVPAGDEVFVQSLLKEHQIRGHIRVVAGGLTRQASVAAGLSALPDDCDVVLVHDGARPLVSSEVIERVAKAARFGAVTAAWPIHETVKRVVDAVVVQTVDRSQLWSVQTPQGFPRDLLERAHAAGGDGEEATDDCALVERLGETVRVVLGAPENIKITTPADLSFLKRWLSAEETTPSESDIENECPRMGIGYDVHRLTPERPLILGGVEIPFELGLLGHSDADVLTHACIDALLGAAGWGDIGQHFPDNDPLYAGASSLGLLRQVVSKLHQRHLYIGGVDAIVIAEKPRLAKYIPMMRARLAEAMDVPSAKVNVKATTNEGLGFLGRQEGIAAQAVAWLEGSKRRR
ncbi:MAG: 2-C-methyl-D-erythritol 4-phosphate cytidylyltransferase [Firmicutes bacterium]|nr:2-C-methyl-D-erythritol 4-phosphate cytidylyltransferase [Bacillota bacterium]